MLLLRLAFRNIWLHRVRTLIVGGLIAFGTMLVVLGNAVLDGVSGGVERAIVHSISGHVQVYSADAKDELALFGQPGSVEQDIGRIDDFGVVREALGAIDNVSAVVPQGTNYSIVFGRNPLDNKLADLRRAVREGDRGQIDSLKEHIRQIISLLAAELEGADAAATLETIDEDDLEALEQATTDGFWERFDDDPLASLEVLDNSIAPLGLRESMLWFRYLGTDPQLYAEKFELFEIASGEMIPQGQRGILVNELVYEKQIKNRVAARLDVIRQLKDEAEESIANDEELRNRIRHNVSQYQTVTWELDRGEAAQVAAAIRPEVEAQHAEVVAEAALVLGEGYAGELAPFLRGHWGLDDGDISKLMRGFLRMTDADFDRRYQLFYDHIAPKIPLYRHPIGSKMALTAFTRAGYVTSVNVKIWGTFRIKSLEDSAFAGLVNIVDMVSFRDLYGFVTPEQRAEIEAIKEDADVEVISREDAEAALFGGGDDDDAEETGGRAGDAADAAEFFAEIDTAEITGRRAEAIAAQLRGYEQAELERGPVLNVAVFLKDPLLMDDTRAKIVAAGERIGVPLQTSTWQEASGLVGQFTLTVRIVLNVAIGIIFLVALVIINNSMVMATMERVREIGTMRAIGARRSFVLSVFLVETLYLGGLFGGLGAALGALGVGILGTVGIPAFHEALYLLFAGPRLYPELAASHILVALGVIVVVALLSTFYPAFLATRIQPVLAMQAKE